MATPAQGIGPMIMAALAARNASGGATPGGPTPAGSPGAMPGGDDTGQQYASEYASLKGADPGMLVRQIKQMKQQMAVLMVQNLERLPNVAGQLAKIIPMFDRVLKELQQASNVQSSVRPPLGMGAAMPPQETSQGGI